METIEKISSFLTLLSLLASLIRRVCAQAPLTFGHANRFTGDANDFSDRAFDALRDSLERRREDGCVVQMAGGRLPVVADGGSVYRRRRVGQGRCGCLGTC